MALCVMCACNECVLGEACNQFKRTYSEPCMSMAYSDPHDHTNCCILFVAKEDVEEEESMREFVLYELEAEAKEREKEVN